MTAWFSILNSYAGNNVLYLWLHSAFLWMITVLKTLIWNHKNIYLTIMDLWGVASQRTCCQRYLLGGTRYLLGGTGGPLSNLYKSRGGTEGPLKNLLRSGVRNLGGTEGSLENFLRSGRGTVGPLEDLFRSGGWNLGGTEGPLKNLLSCGGKNLWWYGGRNLIRFITYMNLRHPGSHWPQDFNVLIVLTFNPGWR